MTEKEKMLSGQNYLARDPELILLHKNCRKILSEFNSITSDNVESRISILNKLFEKVEDGVWIESPFIVIMVLIFQLEKTLLLILIVFLLIIIK